VERARKEGKKRKDRLAIDKDAGMEVKSKWGKL
jgi:hypothetical protein